MRKTKIVCTLGPATADEKAIEQLVLAGTDVVRLNFSHGDHESHRESIRIVRRVAAKHQRAVGILQDLQGPKIRLGELPDGPRELAPGEEIDLCADGRCPADALPVSYDWLAEDVCPGDSILLADGLVELKAIHIEGGRVRCEVVAGGPVSSRKGVNLPRSELRIPSFTEKDRRDLEFGCAQGVDMIALSFVRHEDDMAPVHEILDRADGVRPLVLAKIEKPQAVDRLDQIIERVDAIMVARGDLGVEMAVEAVPLIQKRIIEAARVAARPVITATQMLRSMVDNPRPTRAEASDVANAILDGTDAVMLSEESAIGRYPVRAVQVLDRISRTVEAELDPVYHLDDMPPDHLPTTSAAISRAACMVADDIGAKAIVATTTSGSTARMLALYRPSAPVVGLSTDKTVMRQLALSWGVYPAFTPEFPDTDGLFALSREWCLQHELAKPGDPIIVTAGLPIALAGRTNLLHVIEA